MFSKSPIGRLPKSRLRKLMCLFFLAMAIPTAFLVYKSYDQLKWEAFFQHRQLAEELSNRIDEKLVEFVEREQRRPFGDYSYATSKGDEKFLARSPLSVFPLPVDSPGVVGYFQIDANGLFSSPLLPVSEQVSADLTVSLDNRSQREELQQQVEEILSSNQLVQKSEFVQAPTNTAALSFDPYNISKPYERDISVSNQAAFDKLSDIKNTKTQEQANSAGKGRLSSRIQELELESPYKEKVGQRKQEILQKKTKKSSEPVIVGGAAKNVLDQVKSGSLEKRVEVQAQARSSRNRDKQFDDASSAMNLFENEIDSFEVSLLKSGHFVLYRKVWLGGQRYIQGLLVEQAPFINGLISDSYSQSLLADMSILTVIYQGNAVASFSSRSLSASSRGSDPLSGTLLYKTQLSEPFNELENIFTVRHLPAGAGGRVVLWAAFIVALVLGIGCFLLYRMSLRNLALVDQQQDFVSAISHELKTPLTSIRMYGEMLQQGWVESDKKKVYYNYIFDESERLTRLINNVLQLARMTRNETPVDMKRITVAELIDIIHSKIDSQIERSNFSLDIDVPQEVEHMNLDVDPDIITQIIINLVDNAIKFSAKSENRQIDISVNKHQHDSLCFSIRDYGPGVAQDQLKKIFELFYRSENELTRETTGTGIGLALVSQLTQLMDGKIDVINLSPGAQFRLYFPVAK